jgi:hypothetical protein
LAKCWLAPGALGSSWRFGFSEFALFGCLVVWLFGCLVVWLVVGFGCFMCIHF